MRETLKRRMPLAVERLEGRWTLSHTPLAPPNDAFVYDPMPRETAVAFASRGTPSVEYAAPMSGNFGMSTGMLGGPGFNGAPRSSEFGASTSAYREPGSEFMTSARTVYDAPYASPQFSGKSLSAEPTVQFALVIPNNAQFDPLLVVIVDRTIVGILQPTNFRAAPGGGNEYTHVDVFDAFPQKQPSPSGPRGATTPDYSAAVVIGEMHGPSESPAARPLLAATAGLAGGIGLAYGNNNSAAPSFGATPSLLIPGLPRSDGAATPGFGLLVPPGDSGPTLRERVPMGTDAEVPVEPETTAPVSAVEDTIKVAATPDASGPLDEIGQTAAMLDAIGLRMDAVDQALEGALAEIERLGGEFASWLGEFGLGTWSIPSGAAAALGAGAYFSLRSTRRSEDEEHEEESSSWLFSRLQTPTGHA